MEKTTFPLTALLPLLSFLTCKKNDPDPGSVLGISAAGNTSCGVSFSSETNNASAYEWDFGDGSAKIFG